MITPAFGLTATERVLPKLALDFTTAVLDARVAVTRTTNATNPATYIDSSGVITAATNNQPRFDYDPVTLLCRGLLIEESRANSLLNTDLLATQIVTVTAAVRTLSFYGTGSVTLSGAHSAVVSGTGVYPTRTTYSFTPSAGALTLTVTGTVQFAQLEAGAFATSYIPTTTTSLTRNADVVSMTGTNFSDWYTSTGSFSVNIAPLTANAGAGRVICAFYNSSDATQYMRYRSDNGAPNYFINGGGDNANFYPSGSFAANTFRKFASAFSLNNSCASFNGGAVSTDTSVIVPTVDALSLSGNTSFIMKSFNFYPQRLINAEIQAVSK